MQLEVDHFFCSPDVIHQKQSYKQNKEEKPSDYNMMQCVSISPVEQNIVLHTDVEYDTTDGLKEIERVRRKVKQQTFSATFPIYLYNIGMKKIII